MLRTLREAVRELFAGPPEVDCIAFRKLTEAHPTPGTRLGTMAEAGAAAVDARLALQRASREKYDIWLPERIDRILDVLVSHQKRHDPNEGSCNCGRRFPIEKTDAVVGAVSEVARLFDPCHFLGFEVHSGPDGWTLEYLELLDRNLQVLRHNGRVVGIQEGYIMRMESKGGIHYV